MEERSNWQPTTLGASVEEVLPDDAEQATQDYQDLDPAEWLARDDSHKVDYVIIGDARLKVGILTQGEWENLEAQSRGMGVGRVNPANPRGPRLRNANWLARAIIAFAINKAAGREVASPDALKAKATGELIAIQKAVLRVSGIDEGDNEVFD